MCECARNTIESLSRVRSIEGIHRTCESFYLGPMGVRSESEEKMRVPFNRRQMQCVMEESSLVRVRSRYF